MNKTPNPMAAPSAPRSRRCRAALLATLSLSACLTARADLFMSSSLGTQSRDPLVGANPFFVWAGDTQYSEISVYNPPFATDQITGPVQLKLRCCKDPVTGEETLLPGGVSLRLTSQACREPTFAIGRRPTDLGLPFDRSRPPTLALPVCQTTTDLGVDVSPNQWGRTFLRLHADSTAAPRMLADGLLANVEARWNEGPVQMQKSIDVALSVVPPWPADGPTPPCATNLTGLPLGSISPSPYVIRQGNLSKAAYTLGAGFPSTSPAASVGIEFEVAESGNNLLAPDVATVSFTNTTPIGWPVGVRAVNRADCGAPGPQILVPAGETRTFTFNAATTTTLIFSKSSCRAWINIGNCWNQSALGLDDFLVLSEGPFWLLFGNHRVTIKSVGDWARIPVANSVLTINTP